MFDGQVAYRDAHVVLYQGDCRRILRELVQDIAAGYHEPVHMIFADPPYNLSNGGITCHAGRMVPVDKGEWDRSRGLERDHQFNLEWLAACRDVLDEDGTLWVSGTYHVIYSVGFAALSLGYKVLNDIAWFKPNAAPNLSCRYFTASHETLLWLARSPASRHTFNYGVMKEENGGKQMRSVWTIPTPSRTETKLGKHPTQKPLALLRRIIRASTNPGDLVLDPFSGSGTTGVACLELGRRYIGIEMDEQYLDLSIQRLRQVQTRAI